MEEALRPHLGFLKYIVSTPEVQRKILLKTCSDDQILILCEIALNIYKGNVVDRGVIDIIRRHLSLIQALVNRKLTNRAKIMRMVRNNEVMIQIIRPFLTILESSDAESSH